MQELLLRYSAICFSNGNATEVNTERSTGEAHGASNRRSADAAGPASPDTVRLSQLSADSDRSSGCISSSPLGSDDARLELARREDLVHDRAAAQGRAAAPAAQAWPAAQRGPRARR